MFKSRTTEALQRIEIERSISDVFYRLVDNTTLSYDDIRVKLIDQFDNEEEFIDSLINEERYQ
jgi:hypothetical protein